MTISENDFKEVRKRLQAQRGGNEDSVHRRVPPVAVRCDACGSRLVVVKSARGQRYYRCKRGMLGDIRYGACRTVTRVPDYSFAPLPTTSTMEEIMESKKTGASNELATERHTAVYAREARADPGQSSLEAQVDACVRQADEDGEPPIGATYVFRDQGSGLQLDHPGLNQLRRAVQAGEVGVVYVCSPDRLLRSLHQLALLHEEFASAGVEIRFVRGSFDTNFRGRFPVLAYPGSTALPSTRLRCHRRLMSGRPAPCA